MSTGTIFDIQHYSLNDGPGIRTTVFFKGCPLSCLWCQNPEGRSKSIKLWHFEKKCISCGTCVKSCPEGALSFIDEHAVSIDHKKCTQCGICVDRCPSNALSFDGHEIDAAEVENEILNDLIFYRSSQDGGVTLSGGDPLFQYGFAGEILSFCRKHDIPTAIETCLFADRIVVDTLEKLVDFFITDIKIFDQEFHRKATGVSNKKILENFKVLAQKRRGQHNLLVRIPLIPRYTATKENIDAIAQFIFDTDPDIPIELINFNPLAESKFKRMGLTYQFGNCHPFTDSELSDFKTIISDHGIRVINRN